MPIIAHLLRPKAANHYKLLFWPWYVVVISMAAEMRMKIIAGDRRSINAVCCLVAIVEKKLASGANKCGDDIGWHVWPVIFIP